jgi:hypothetical protein
VLTDREANVEPNQSPKNAVHFGDRSTNLNERHIADALTLQWSASPWPIKRELGSRYMDQNLATWALLVALRFTTIKVF